jgi:uncharacterized membrane protein YccC
VNRLFDHIALQVETGRAVRASAAFTIPLVICHVLGRPGDGMFIAIAAQTIALPDLRGSYAMRLAILATMITVVAGSTLLGLWAGGSIVSATLAMGMLALLGAGWRHLSADYGPPLSVASALLFLLGLAHPGSSAEGWHLVGLIMLGGAGAALLQILFWPFRPQHPLRYAVAESWVAVSDLAASMRGGPTGELPASRSIADSERELRATLDRTFVILGAAEGRQPSALLTHLEEMRREVVHFAMRLLAFHSSLESLLRRPEFARNLPTVDSVFKALSDAARSVAITIITHRRENFAATEVRLRRGEHLILVLAAQLAKAGPDLGVAQAQAALEQIARVLPCLRKALAETIDHGDARGISPVRLADLTGRSIHSLAAWINPSPVLDPVLVRYALRMASLTMAAVAFYKGFAIPRGYWIAFTIVVVLQPDYGSTRQRAVERIGGTLAGSLLGSALLWIKMPLFLLDGFVAVMAFGFAFFLKRRYGVAVFFVTLMLVLVTETTGPVHLDFTISRLLMNAIGGTVALVSAVLFWPIWEGEKFPTLLAGAIRANRAYLEAIAASLSGDDARDLLLIKRRAENADRFASASLQRMLAEPGSDPERGERAASLITYNQRITRACTAITVHLHGDQGIREADLAAAARTIGGVLETLAQTIERDWTSSSPVELETHLAGLENLLAATPVHSIAAPGPFSPTDLIWIHLAKSLAEIRAIALVLARPGEKPPPSLLR